MSDNEKPKSPLAQLSEKPKSPLAQLSEMPNVAGVFNFALVSSHRHALDIAADTLVGTSNTTKMEIIKSVLSIFEKWKYEHGVYPANNKGSSGELVGKF